MKSMFQKLHDWIVSFDRSDAILVFLALFVLIVVWIGVRITGNDVDKENLTRQNKKLTDSCSVLIKKIRDRDELIELRDQRIATLESEFQKVVRVAETKSIQYEQKQKENEKIRNNYRRLPFDQRVRVFTNQISGGH